MTNQDWMIPEFKNQTYEQCVKIAQEFRVNWVNRLEWGWRHVLDNYEHVHESKQMRFDVLFRGGEMFTILLERR